MVAAAPKQLSSVEILWAAAFEKVEVRRDNVGNELGEQAHTGDTPYVGVVKDPEVRRTLAQALGQGPAEAGIGIGRVAGQGVRSFTTAGEKAIGTTGFFLFGVLTSIMAVLKLTVITDWSWWRVSLPVAIFSPRSMVT